MTNPIYLDYAATTPVDPRVAEKMSHCLLIEGKFGNPASRSHKFGWEAEEAVEVARRQVADLLGADPREIVWTSGATEADNLAIKGVVEALSPQRRHIVTAINEHKAVVDTCRHLEKQGCEVSWLTPGTAGTITPDQVAAVIRDDTAIVSIMHVNNETGVANDIAAIGTICRDHGVYFHVDAAQSAGKLPIDLRDLPVDLMSFSAHKLYGPKGIGALFVRRQPRVRLEAQIHGGGHERGMRSGTLATHQIVGMGEAFRIAAEEDNNESLRIAALRDRFLQGVLSLEATGVNGTLDAHVPGIVNVYFDHVDGESLMMSMTDIAVSSGSACTSASIEPSYVLRAMGVPDERAHSSIRFSFGRFTTEKDVDLAVEQVKHAVSRLRELSDSWNAHKNGQSDAGKSGAEAPQTG